MIRTAFLTALIALAQVPFLKGYYVEPVRTNPLTLSGSVGEFRANHFHSGLDFRVGGVTGAPVYAAADGYISRITVSPGGYGNALYITHSNGTVSLYGHLDRFAPSVAKYVEEQQYRLESFRVDLVCDPVLFPVKKGQEIAKAGNSGDSAGPHLHFEIRYTDSLQSEFSADLLGHRVFSFQDNLPPEFRLIQFHEYYTGDYGTPGSRLIAGLDGQKNRVLINVPDTFYVSVDAIDRMNGTNSRMGIQKWTVELDGKVCFCYENRDLPLDKTRYINSLIQYPERARNYRSLLKTWVEPGNVLRDRILAPANGLISLPDSLTHKLTITVSDAAGNFSRREFSVRKVKSLKVLTDGFHPEASTIDSTDRTVSVINQEYGQLFFWDKENSFTADGLRISVPARALYKNIPFSAIKAAPDEWILYTADEPLHMPMCVQMNIPSSIPHSLLDKVILLRQAHTGPWQSVGGERKDSVLTAFTNAFGRFRISVDTIAPTVSASFNKGGDVRGRHAVYFTIKDECSGIDSYRVTIDGKWALFVHDGKRSRITGTLDPRRIEKGKKHNLELVVTDNRQNSTTYNTSFIW